MILQALCEYYQRKANFSEGVAPEGFETKGISFLIEYDKNGRAIAIHDIREKNGKKLIGKPCLVPSLPIGTKRVGTKIVPNLLWDSCDYSLGFSLKENELNNDKLNAFIQEIIVFNEKIRNYKLDALISFLKNKPLDALEKIAANNFSEAWEELKKSEKNIIGFTFEGDNLEPITTILAKEISLYRSQNNNNKDIANSICLVTGEKSDIARLHKSIPQWGGGMASLVSFQKDSGYDSYGKKQAENAPVSPKAVEWYTNALDLLLNKQDYSHCRMGNTTICFWSKQMDDFLEHSFANLFWTTNDNPDKNILELKHFFYSIKTGKNALNFENTFYILGLEPLSKGRATVRFWYAESYENIKTKFENYFFDIAIDSEDGVYPLNWYLRTLVLESGTPPKRDLTSLPPNLSGELIRSILDGVPFPYRLINCVINRIRAECSRDKDEKKRDNYNHIDACRVALLKAYLNQKKRSPIFHITDKEITMSLDKENTNVGYRLGRLFAIFELLQRAAQGENLNSTIKDRYYGAASSTPNSVFPLLVKLSTHHLAKVSECEHVFFEKTIGEIMEGILAEGFPAHLNLDDQARFAIGYYHQRQNHFKPKEEK